MPGRRIKRIKAANITYLSLVPRGATQLGVLYKDDSGSVEVAGLAKSLGEGRLLAAVYVPGLEDAHGDFADDPKVIEQMAHTFLKNGAKLDVLHNEETLSKTAAFVAESFIIQKGDERFKDLKTLDGRSVDATGGWGAVIKIEDPKLQSLYADNRWNGVSMFGPAIVEHVSKSKEEPDMTPEEIAKLVAQTVAGLKAELTTEVTQVVKSLLPKAPEERKVTVTYDPSKPETLETAMAEIRKQQIVELAKGVDFSDPQQSKAFADKCAKLGVSSAQQNKGGVTEQIAELRKQLETLTKQAAKDQRRSAQPTGDERRGNSGAENPTDEEEFIENTKDLSHKDAVSLGKMLAKSLNSRRGYPHAN